MKVLIRLTAFVGKHWRLLFLAFICLIGTIVFSLAVPRLIGDGIDNALKQGERSVLIWIAVGVVTASALRGIAGYGNTFFSQAVSQKTAYDIRNAIYDRLQRLSFAFHDSAQTGQLMSRATADVEAIRMFLGNGLLGLAQTILLFIGVTYFLVSLNWQLTLITMAFMPLIGWRAIVVRKKLEPIWLKIQQLLAALGTILEESLTGVRVVKTFSRQKEESRKFSGQATLLYDEQIHAAKEMAINMPMMMFFFSLTTVFIIWFGGQQVIAGNLTIGNLIQFILYLGLMAMPVRRLGFLVNMLSRTISAGGRIFEILDTESAVQERTGAIELGKVTGQVSFQNVSFSYDSAAPALDDVSFNVQPGNLVALLGSSGSGKSTIANLLSRFYDVTGGSIAIDGTDIRDVTLTSLRRNVGIVQQDIFLFSATIHDNIAYGAVNADKKQIEEVAKAAHLHDFIMNLPDRYNTWVGERGITLSGGEKQRLAIARTLLINPAILILDDSMSSVDAETEKMIRKALTKLIKGRTTFIITHRLPIIKNADLILVVENGKLVEHGKHDELIKNDGPYQHTYQLQLSVT